MYNLGITSSIPAELWGVLTGLDLVWSLSCQKFIVEMDSLIV